MPFFSKSVSTVSYKQSGMPGVSITKSSISGDKNTMKKVLRKKKYEELKDKRKAVKESISFNIF